MNPQNSFYSEDLFCIKDGYILREIAGEFAIIPVDEECLISNAVMIPNETAVFIWKQFQEPCSIEDVVSECSREYDASEDVIRADVYRFVRDALKCSLLERESEI